MNRMVLAPPAASRSFGLGDHVADVLDRGGRRAEVVELRLGLVGDDHGQRGLAHPRRPAEEDAAEPVGLEHPRQQLPRPEEMPLARRTPRVSCGRIREARGAAALRFAFSWASNNILSVRLSCMGPL